MDGWFILSRFLLGRLGPGLFSGAKLLAVSFREAFAHMKHRWIPQYLRRFKKPPGFRKGAVGPKKRWQVLPIVKPKLLRWDTSLLERAPGWMSQEVSK